MPSVAVLIASVNRLLYEQNKNHTDGPHKKEWGVKEKKKLLRKPINQSNGLRVIHIHTENMSSILISALSLHSKPVNGRSRPTFSHFCPRRLHAGWHCERVDLNPFWPLTHDSSFHPLAVHSPVTKLKFGRHSSCCNRFLFSLILPVGSGITVRFFLLGLGLGFVCLSAALTLHQVLPSAVSYFPK